MHDEALRKNGEGYPDPTAYEAIKRVSADEERHEKYVDAMIKMIQEDFLIRLTDEQKKYLHSLRTEVAVENAVHKIIYDGLSTGEDERRRRNRRKNKKKREIFRGF